MTRQFSVADEAVATRLIAEAGTGLFNVVREAGVTCEVCAIPLDTARGYRRCFQCAGHVAPGKRLADRVGSLVYALEGDSQVYKIVHNYKAPTFANTRLPSLMEAMLALGLRTHYHCARLLAGERTQGWAVVPSTKGRTKLRELVMAIGAPANQEIAIRYSGAKRSDRLIHSENWAVTEQALPQHVLVIDDSWVTGASAQGVAVALRNAGVEQVSIFTVARVVRPDFGPNGEFVKGRMAGSDFDWKRCPWTGGACPELPQRPS